MDKPTTLSTKQAAELLAVSPMTVIRLWRAGQIKAYKANPEKKNSPLMIDAESVQAFIQTRKQPHQ